MEIQEEIFKLGDERSLISDGSHTFDELYFHRMTLFSVICDAFKDNAWKSKKHHDGTMYPNYFIVGVETPEGQFSYHYHMEHYDRFKVCELENAPEWDGHTSDDVTRVLSLLNGGPFDPWIKNEIDKACEGEDCGYAKAIYNSAAKAYMSLARDGHSGFSIGLTQNILERFISRKPLTPLTGSDDEWSDVVDRQCDHVCYQNSRYSALFKHVYADGRIEYSDVNQFECADVNRPQSRFTAGYINRRLRDRYPITFPYNPPDNPIVVYVEEFLYREDGGDFDTVGVMYLTLQDGTKVDINMFLGEDDSPNRPMVEITKEEYLYRRNNKIR